MTSKFCALVLSGLMMLVLTACTHPPFYSAKEIHGQIVDAATGEPLEGVIIVAQWELFQVGPGHGGHKGQMVNVIEAVTDSSGSYFIPGWGPRPRMPFNYLDDRDPVLLIYKIGYIPQGLSNPLLSEEHMNRDSLRTSQWDGKVIRLKKFEGENIEKYASNLSSLRSSLADDGHKFRSYPRMFLALDAEQRRLDSLGHKPGYSVSAVYVESLNKVDQKFLERYKQSK